MTRACSKVIPEKGHESSYFVEQTSPNNVICIKMTSTRKAELQKNVYVCLIDQAKSFLKELYIDLFEIIEI